MSYNPFNCPVIAQQNKIGVLNNPITSNAMKFNTAQISQPTPITFTPPPVQVVNTPVYVSPAPICDFIFGSPNTDPNYGKRLNF
jgi:hypothetical protein